MDENNFLDRWEAEGLQAEAIAALPEELQKKTKSLTPSIGLNWKVDFRFDTPGDARRAVDFWKQKNLVLHGRELWAALDKSPDAKARVATLMRVANDLRDELWKEINTRECKTKPKDMARGTFAVDWSRQSLVRTDTWMEIGAFNRKGDFVWDEEAKQQWAPDLGATPIAPTATDSS